MSRKIACGLLALTLAGPAFGADFSDPTWPCIQRKVESLSPALMWPMDPAAAERELSEAEDDAVAELADTLALRRIDLEEAGTRVAAFAEAHGGDPVLLGQTFLRVFDHLSTRRTRVMDGIAEFSLSQIALSKRIDAARAEMDTLMQADEPDYDRVDEIEEQLAWDERIYTDRQRTLTYVCETPVLLEKRLYALAQMLQTAATD
ncbi:hypothetical protein [Roseivivax isoporae]|uniref:Uncharacterized protein n=1 Tax=Roseivivax isoporae LMG 25204 TaxID=1449351 RepID=X7F782_9RHOB|nr:hypothetical protein [Roseivivax isoporae]ETX28655.1 hypothetical protein RISW2_04995 [Roseivivax isoporae LMG 25204]